MRNKFFYLLFLSAYTLSNVIYAAPLVLEPNITQAKVVHIATRMLSTLHYKPRTWDDALSEIIWQRYINSLDKDHIYFTSADMKSFEAWRYLLDDQLKDGDLSAIFFIYNRSLQRQYAYLTFAIEALEHDAGLRKINDSEINSLWRKHLQAELQKITKNQLAPNITLKNQYLNRLARLKRANSNDAFLAFMNELTGVYDPHTSFHLKDACDLKLGGGAGVGITLKIKDDFPTIANLIPDSAAGKSQQLQIGDRIIAVAESDDQFINVMSFDLCNVIKHLQGGQGTSLRLLIQSEISDIKREVRLIRDSTQLSEQGAKRYVLTSERAGTIRRVGVIHLPYFYAIGHPDYISATHDVRHLIKELEKERVEGIIIDLRGNSGGLLKEVNSLLGEFIGTGPTVQIRDAQGSIDIMGNNEISVSYQGPMAIIINRLTASGAEIFAAGLQDYGRALIIGSTSFGNGSIRSIRSLGSYYLQLTEAQAYRLSGAGIQTRGVQPDVALPDIYDNQLWGESSLEFYLPNDSIKPETYRQLNRLQPTLLHKLTLASKKRLDMATEVLTPDTILKEAVEVFLDSLD